MKKKINDYRWLENYSESHDDEELDFEPFKHISCNFTKVIEGNNKILKLKPLYISKTLENKKKNLDDVIAIYWYLNNKLYRLSNYWGSVYYENSIFRLTGKHYLLLNHEKEIIYDIPVLGVVDFDIKYSFNKPQFIQFFEKISINKLKLAYKNKHFLIKDGAYILANNIVKIYDPNTLFYDFYPKTITHDSFNLKFCNNIKYFYNSFFKLSFDNNYIIIKTIEKVGFQFLIDFLYIVHPVNIKVYLNWVKNWKKEELEYNEYINKLSVCDGFSIPTRLAIMPSYISTKQNIILFNLAYHSYDEFEKNIFGDIFLTLEKNENYKYYKFYLITNPIEQSFNALEINIVEQTILKNKIDLKKMMTLLDFSNEPSNKSYPIIDLFNCL